LLPVNTPVPHIGPPGTPDWTGLYATYHQAELRVFAGGVSNLFLVMAGLCAVGALGALLLRSGAAAPTPPAGTVAPARPEYRPPPVNGQVNGARKLVTAVVTTNHSRPRRQHH
jgi:hypothetical protein